MKTIRNIALGIILRDQHVLVQECVDPSSGESYFKPIGGGIRSREQPQLAMLRELKEELSINYCELKSLAVLKNIFEYDGQIQHEIVYVYRVSYLKKSFYKQEEYTFTEPNHGPQKAYWVEISKLQSGELTLYPKGVRDVLNKLIQKSV